MYLLQEDLARAHIDARLEQAREQRRTALLIRARLLAVRAERAALRARLLLAQAG